MQAEVYIIMFVFSVITEIIVMMTKLASLSPGTGLFVIGRGHISRMVKMLNFIKQARGKQID